MALKKYKKNPIKVKLTEEEYLAEQERLRRQHNEERRKAKALAKRKQAKQESEKPVEKNSKKAGQEKDYKKEETSTTTRFILKNTKFVFPVITATIGITLILGEVVPSIRQMVAQNYTQKFDQRVVAIAEPQVLGIESVVISKPDSEYFKNLVQNIERKSKFVEPPDIYFSEDFAITIPKINADHFPVSSNVDSYNEDEYDSVLDSSLAHFKGTNLPYQNGNSVIYGHSATGIFGNYTGKYIFSKLSNLEIGDDIYIDIAGERYHYQVTKSTIVDPENLSVITSSKSRKSLTLITCYPNGSPAKRLVVVAEEV